MFLIILEFRTDFGDIFNNVYFTIFERDPVSVKKYKKTFGAKFLPRI